MMTSLNVSLKRILILVRTAALGWTLFFPTMLTNDIFVRCWTWRGSSTLDSAPSAKGYTAESNGFSRACGYALKEKRGEVNRGKSRGACLTAE